MNHVEKRLPHEIFASHVFTDGRLRAHLEGQGQGALYEELREIVRAGRPMSPHVAEAVARAMCAWASELGATHYSHWFQPLTGVTAEKHQCFLTRDRNGEAHMALSATELAQGESDASSFPSGGIRATFEARGVTTWDYTSPAFLKEDNGGRVLCIPTSFSSGSGQALDEKTPLLRAGRVLNMQALRLLQLLGDYETTRVSAMVGAEQEYFLLDQNLFNRRMDMVFSGRTLLGAKPSKNQEMEGHYYGAIKERISAYMQELDERLWRMGVPANTRHNEAAPAQHEMAPMFTEANVAADQNQLIMETMRRVAEHHNLICVHHPKPFHSVNGSGKHVNWSLATDTGRNLMEPGGDTVHNAVFLTLVTAVVAAVSRHAGLLRLSAATPGNDLRLGGFEAPPAIVSIFLGDTLLRVLRDAKFDHLPPIIGESDRNRTSPLAFTGNRFEFRMLSANQSISFFCAVMAAAVAEALDDIATNLEVRGGPPMDNLTAVLRETLFRHDKVIYNGDGYAREWAEKAAKRRLPQLQDCVEAIPVLRAPETEELFVKYGILSKVELEAREEVRWEEYANALYLEASVMLEMVDRQILPACMKYQGELARHALDLEHLTGEKLSLQRRRCAEMGETIPLLRDAFTSVKKVMETSKNEAMTAPDKALYFRDRLIPAMARLREGSDKLERIMPESEWPMPTYNELLFNI